jgi:hypothetical protein
VQLDTKVEYLVQTRDFCSVFRLARVQRGHGLVSQTRRLLELQIQLGQRGAVSGRLLGRANVKAEFSKFGLSKQQA